MKRKDISHAALASWAATLFPKRSLGLSAFAYYLAVFSGLAIADGPEETEASHQSRGFVPVAVHVVACSPNLLHCRDLETGSHTFGDMGDCRASVDEIQRAALASERGRPVVMARCRYLPSFAKVSKSAPELAGFPPGSPPHIPHFEHQAIAAASASKKRNCAECHIRAMQEW